MSQSEKAALQYAARPERPHQLEEGFRVVHGGEEWFSRGSRAGKQKYEEDRDVVLGDSKQ